MNMQVTEQSAAGREGVGARRVQYSTFYVANRLYGVDVTRVQEVVKPMQITKIPLAEKFVQGLINLRGQVVTAVSLHELFGLKEPARDELMNVICKADGALVSLQVDVIGDVVEVEESSYEPAPSTVPEPVRKFMTRIYKSEPELLSILDVDQIFLALNG
jgi:purine-binding chemotaxis protein CheW